ncbi:Cyanophycinase [Saliniradius amylolyticus]|uniref:Cyanophycinase n=1 Tax=Saliniradius amylolyticus TaxID=2183582 RepID=A0A2S2E0M7_9ALTE|nr:cyanophycinase [Saliniradius amylolyticus]AWL11173.1 Cyanophycinase [Saliniradius amylolyticus]
MKKWLTGFLMLVASAASGASDKGSLVIAGGAISSNSVDILTTFADLAGGTDARIGVVPAATSSVDKQFKLLEQIFSAHGVPVEQVVLLPLAVKDDKDTEVDESSWKHNAKDRQLADAIAELSAIWFIGGDQTLITQSLLNEDGSDTPVLKAMRTLYANGGTLGGTSAGAAIMSQLMIAGGNSQGALFEGFKQDFSSMNEQEYGPVVTSRGLGFFTNGVIDQHFDRKARLGRLIVTLLNDDANIGYGVDEGSAMVVSGNGFQVIGESGVTVVDTRDVSDFKQGRYPLSVKGIRLSFVQSGDSYDMAAHQYYPRDGAAEVVGNEYFDVPAQHIAGILNANRDLDQFIGYNLLDNQATDTVHSWVRQNAQAKINLIFTQDAQSQGYWSQDLTADVYSFTNVRLDIVPMKGN